MSGPSPSKLYTNTHCVCLNQATNVSPHREESFDSIARRLESQLEKAKGDPVANGRVNQLGEDYKSKIRQARTSILLLHHSRCPHCRRIIPILDDLAEEYNRRVFFAMVNIEETEGVRDELDVTGVPLLVAFKKGHRVAQTEGFRQRVELDEWIGRIARGLRPMDLRSGPVSRLD
ncbi:thioredoxin [Candidatus Thorarchaeota archaeon]|nr:MAG: thioredoxin [Candidatus Thorarchaeota archaeon]